MTLYRETPCEQCGEPPGEHDGPVTDGCEGPGGSREVVTIDYEAGAKRIWFMSPCEQSWDYVVQTATLAIDAALHTEKESASTLIGGQP